MAGRPIEIPIIVNADGAERGANQVSDAFDDVSDALRDTGRAGDRTADQLEDGMSDAAREIDRDLTRALENVADQARTTGRTVGREISDGTDRASEGMGQMSDDANSNAREVAASFDGSADSIVDGFQGAAAEMFAGFGPAGAAAGLAVAFGIGLAVTALTDHADKINENKEKMLDLAQTIKDNGGKLSMVDYIQAMDDFGFAIQDSKEWFEIFQSDAVTGFEQIRDGAEKAGVSVRDAFLGQFGSADEAQRVLSVLEDELKELEDQTKSSADANAEWGIAVADSNPAIQEQIKGNKELSEKVREHQEVLEDAAEHERIRRQAIEGTVEATLEDVAALEKRNGLLQDGVTSELDYRDQVVETTATLEENGKTLDINTQAGRDNQRALMDQSDAALEMAQSQLTAGVSADTVAASLEGQREALLITLDAMTGNRAESEKLAASLGLIPSEVITEVKTNGAAESKTAIEQIPATAETAVTVSDNGGAANVQSQVNSIADTSVDVDVDDRGTVERTVQQIQDIDGTDVDIDVDDRGTVERTQRQIDEIKGRDVDINIRLANLQDIENTLVALTLPRTAYVDIVQRRGQEAP